MKSNVCASPSVQTGYLVNLDYLLVAAYTAYSSSEKKCKMYFSKAVSVCFFIILLKYH